MKPRRISPCGECPRRCAALSVYTYKLVQFAAILVFVGTILGAAWADKAWGRYWGWDPKEVWALVCFLVYMVIAHGRHTGWIGNFGLAAGTVLEGSAIMMTWYGVVQASTPTAPGPADCCGSSWRSHSTGSTSAWPGSATGLKPTSWRSRIRPRARTA